MMWAKLWRCWLRGRKGIQPVETSVFICLQWGANDLHMVQLMPLPPIISCSSKIQNGLPFWRWLTQVVLEKRPLNRCTSSRCGASSEKCLLLWHHFLIKIVIIWTFSYTSWLNFIQIKWQIFTIELHALCHVAHNIEIIMWPQITVTSLHPMYN